MFSVQRVAKPQYVALLLSILALLSFVYFAPSPTYTSAAFTNSATATTNISAIDTIYKWTGTANNSASTAGYSNGTVRKNLSTNPSLQSDIADWLYWSGGGPGSASISRASTGGTSGDSFARVTWTGKPASFTTGIYYNLPTITTGTTYAFSMDIRTNSTQRMKLGIEWLTLSGVAFGKEYSSIETVLTAGTWTRLPSFSAVAPANATHVHLVAYNTSGTGAHYWEVGDYIDADAIMVEALSSVGTYFDGSSQ